MKRIIVLIILIVMLPVSSYGYFYQGLNLVAGAKEHDKFIAGLKYDYAKCGIYSGFVLGVYDSTEWMYNKTGDQVSVRQLSAIVSKYIKAHPKQWDLPAYTIVMIAFTKAFRLDGKNLKLFEQVLDAMLKRESDIYDKKP